MGCRRRCCRAARAMPSGRVAAAPSISDLVEGNDGGQDHHGRLGPPDQWPTSAGETLKPEVWPEGRSCCVALSFDLDCETPWEHDQDVGPAVLSSAEYGTKRGIARILSLLEASGTHVTFFVPGLVANRYASLIQE